MHSNPSICLEKVECLILILQPQLQSLPFTLNLNQHWTSMRLTEGSILTKVNWLEPMLRQPIHLLLYLLQIDHYLVRK